MRPNVDSARLVETRLNSMQDEQTHFQQRRVKKVDVVTPLIVPSFSSYRFPHVEDIYNLLKDKLYGVCLVSAMDIASGQIPPDAAEEVNLVLIDSGMYEARMSELVGLNYRPNIGNCVWTRQDFLAVAGSLDHFANVIMVNYDSIEPIEQQIKQALGDFMCAPQAASDFLVKPESTTQLLNVAKLGKYTKELGQFDVIGITARDAGNSLAQRCSAIVMLRDILNDAGLNLPIHVFGAINPLEVLTYSLCGADIFDGLSWLRVRFRESGSAPIDEAAFDGGLSNLTDFELRARVWVSNLRLLYRLQQSLHQYSLSSDLFELAQEFPIARKAARIADLAGAEIVAERGDTSK